MQRQGSYNTNKRVAGSGRMRADERELRRRREKKRRERLRRRYMLMGGLCILLLLVVCMVKACSKDPKAIVNLKVESVSIFQQDSMPELKATATCKKSFKNIVLNKEAKYTVQDLLDELNDGKGYYIECDYDGKTVGSYTVQITLKDKFQKMLENEWKEKVTVSIENGTLTVRDKDEE